MTHGMFRFIYLLSTFKGVYLTGSYLGKLVITADTETRVSDGTKNIIFSFISAYRHAFVWKLLATATAIKLF